MLFSHEIYKIWKKELNKVTSPFAIQLEQSEFQIEQKIQ